MSGDSDRFRGTVGGLSIDVTREDVYWVRKGRDPQAHGQHRHQVEVRRPGRPPAWGAWWPAREALRLLLEDVLPAGTAVTWARIPSPEAVRVFTAMGFTTRKLNKVPDYT
ncbi:MAG: hypothetical protein ACR2J4_05510 [Deinococcus sp.]